MSSNPELVDVASQINELFVLDERVSKASAHILALESPQALHDFLEVEHDSLTYAWMDDRDEMVASLSVVVPPEEDWIEILNIGVDPMAQRGGYGSIMMSYAESMARQSGRSRIVLVTSTDNEQAISFYLKNGFTIEGEVEDIYGDGNKRYKLEKRLV